MIYLRASSNLHASFVNENLECDMSPLGSLRVIDVLGFLFKSLFIAILRRPR